MSEFPHTKYDLTNFLDAEGTILGDDGKTILRSRSNGAMGPRV